MYYVYEIIDPRTNTPFYVGKGSAGRKDAHVQKVRLGKVSENRYKDKYIRDIFAETGSYPESIIVREFDDETEAYIFETTLIKQYGTYKTGGILTNILTENKPPLHTGRKRSAQTKQKLADRCGTKNPMWGRKQSESTKAKWKDRLNPFEGKSGSEHPTSKQWRVITPNGEEHTIISLRQFCTDQNVPYSRVWKNNKGWICKQI